MVLQWFFPVDTLTFEDKIVRPLVSSDMLKLYGRYVDDTLVLAKSSDIPTMLQNWTLFIHK